MINYLHNLLSFTSIFATSPCDPKTHNLFVYGTLKKNEPEHHWLENPKNGVAKFISLGKTVQRYPLIIATKYNMPFLLYSPDKGCMVEGEIYEVDDVMLRKLDILKDHPHFYEREKDIDIIARNKTTGVFETIKCWVYFQKEVTPQLLARTCIGNYSSKGSHKLPFISNGSATKDDLKAEK